VGAGIIAVAGLLAAAGMLAGRRAAEASERTTADTDSVAV
jgi:hypothetical protein